jgi:hypothetical protein
MRGQVTGEAADVGERREDGDVEGDIQADHGDEGHWRRCSCSMVDGGHAYREPRSAENCAQRT